MKRSGALFRVQIDTGDGVWAELAGERVSSVAMQAAFVETTDKASLPWREGMVGGIRQAQVIASGVARDGDAKATRQFMSQRAWDGASIPIRMISGVGSDIVFSGVCRISQLESAGDYNGAESFSVVMDAVGVFFTGGYVPISITSTLAISYTAGQPFSYAITTNIPATSFGASGLPNGTSINTATGLITGTLYGANSYNVTISATDGITSDAKPLLILSTAPENIWYKMNQTSGATLIDSGVNGLHAPLSGSYAFNGGLDLNGAGYAQTPNLPGSYRSGNMSYSVWSKTRSRGALVTGGFTNTYYPPSILSNDVPTAGGRGIGASIWTVSGTPTSEYIEGASFARLLSGQVGTDWEHLALTFSLSDNTQRIYKNGALISTIVTGPKSNEPNTIKIGRHNFDTGSYPGNKGYYFGTIKDVRIYSRSLSASEVNAIYILGPIF